MPSTLVPLEVSMDSKGQLLFSQVSLAVPMASLRLRMGTKRMMLVKGS